MRASSQCSPEEFARLTELNERYNAKFGFPFILAVKGYDRAGHPRASSRGASSTTAPPSSPSAWRRSRGSRASGSTRW